MLSDSKISDLYFEALGSQHLREQDRKTVSRFALTVEAEVRKDDEALIRQMLEALETGHDAATQVAAEFHTSYKGHRPDTHAALDADVERIAKALTAARTRLEKAP